MTQELEEYLTKLYSEISSASQMYTLAKDIGEFSFIGENKNFSNVFWFFQFTLKRECEIGLARIFDRNRRSASIYKGLRLLQNESGQIELKDKSPLGKLLADLKIISYEEITSYEIGKTIVSVTELYLKKWPENKKEWDSNMGEFIHYRRNNVLAHPTLFSRDNYIDTTYNEFDKILKELAELAAILQVLLQNIGRAVSFEVAPAFAIPTLCEKRLQEFNSFMDYCKFQKA